MRQQLGLASDIETCQGLLLDLTALVGLLNAHVR